MFRFVIHSDMRLTAVFNSQRMYPREYRQMVPTAIFKERKKKRKELNSLKTQNPSVII